MIASPRSRMPSAPAASDAPLARPGDRWRLPGLVLLGAWSALLVSPLFSAEPSIVM